MTSSRVRIQQFITRFIAFLSSIHPLIYLCCYVALISSFAFAYIMIPHGFYAPYIRQEREFHVGRFEFGEFLQQVIYRGLRERHGRKDVAVDGGRLSRILFLNVDSSDGYRIKVRLLCNLEDESTSSSAENIRSHQRVGLDVSLLNDFYSTAAVGGHGATYWYSVELINRIDGSQFQQAVFLTLFPAVPRSRYVSPSPQGDLRLNEPERARLEEFTDGLRGDAVSVNGAIGRMFYFSAIVLTTVGFGDIVPIRPLSRTLAGLEAVFGVLVAGLFLNSVAHRASSANP